MPMTAVLTFKIRTGSFASLSGSLTGGYEQGRLLQYLSDVDSLFAADGSELVKDFGHTRTAVVLMDLGKGSQRFVVKQYRSRNFVEELLHTIRKSKAVRAWRMAGKMEKAGISIAAPVAVVEEKQRYLMRCSYLVTVFVENTVNLKAHVVNVGTHFLDDKELMRELGCAIGGMHARGFLHGDLKWSNILIQDMDEVRRPVFVDLDHVAHREGSVHIRLARDLARFMVDVRELALQPALEGTFLSSYFDTVAITGRPRDDFIRQMGRASARIAARHARRG